MSLLRSVCEHFVLPAGHVQAAAREDLVDHDDGPDGACADPAPRTHAGAALLEAPGGEDGPARAGLGIAGAGDDGLAPHFSPAVAVLSAPDDAHALGAVLGLALARRLRVPVVAVCVWTHGERTRPMWRAPALPAARRLAIRLRERGHDAQPAGRLAFIRLPAAAGDAAAHARRVTAAAGDVPVVLALGGPRVAALDALLAEQDVVLVAPPRGTEPVLAHLALAGLDAPSGRTCVWETPASRAARALAGAGVGLAPSTHRSVAATFGGPA